MAEEIEDVVKKLGLQAGPRGFTFAGRVGKSGDTAGGLIQRMPMGSGEGDLPTALKATLGAAAPQLAQSTLSKLLLAGMAKTFRPGPSAIAETAKPGTAPLSPPHKLLPGLMNKDTGEWMHSQVPGPYQHSALYGALPKSWQNVVEGFVDPLTYKGFTNEHLNSLSQTPGLQVSPTMGAGER